MKFLQTVGILAALFTPQKQELVDLDKAIAAYVIQNGDFVAVAQDNRIFPGYSLNLLNSDGNNDVILIDINSNNKLDDSDVLMVQNYCRGEESIYVNDGVDYYYISGNSLDYCKLENMLINSSSSQGRRISAMREYHRIMQEIYDAYIKTVEIPEGRIVNTDYVV